MKQLVKKTYIFDQDLINRVKKKTGASTEVEAITTAMEECLFRRSVLQWHKKHAGKFHLQDLDA